MDIVLLLARLLLAAVFIVSGLAKLADRPGSRQAMLDFGVPARLATPSAIFLPVVELIVAGTLIPITSAWWGAIGALALLLLFTTVMGYHLTRGHTPKCHCFGKISSGSIGWHTLVRNLVLSTVAGTIVGFGRTSAGTSVVGWLGTTTIVERVELGIGGLVVTLLAVKSVALLQLSRKFGSLLQRFEELEARLKMNERREIVEEPPPTEASTPAPAFSLPDLSGEEITLDALLSFGKPLLLLFSDPHCKSCTALMPEVSRWQEDYASKLVLALISRGTLEANLTKANQHGLSLVLLQQDREVAKTYQAYQTPCAVLISPDGKIVGSGPFCGAEQIIELVTLVVGLPTTQPLSGTNDREQSHALLTAAP